MRGKVQLNPRRTNMVALIGLSLGVLMAGVIQAINVTKLEMQIR